MNYNTEYNVKSHIFWFCKKYENVWMLIDSICQKYNLHKNLNYAKLFSPSRHEFWW